VDIIRASTLSRQSARRDSSCWAPLSPCPVTSSLPQIVANTTDGTNAPLETARLRLRQMQMEDVDPLLKVFGDADAMRFYPSPFTREQMTAWVEWNRCSYNEHGYGLWALVLKETNEVVGDCGLTWQPVGYGNGRELEAGWHMRRDLWNRGLATEAGFCVRDYARDVIQRERLIAIVEAGNLPSQSVARKLGMALERVDSLDGKERLIFAMQF
jgi:[ribosomal protein S5]-alanine N-acetyltransferase